MNKLIKTVATAAMLLAMVACGKSPESIVNDAYKNAQEGKFAEIAQYAIPDSVEALTEEERQMFDNYLAETIGHDVYASVTVDSVTVNEDQTEAKFVATTKFKDGRSFTEHGILRVGTDNHWHFVIDKKAGDDTEIYSVSDAEKATPELMRNLYYATVMTLASRGIPEYQVKAGDILANGILTKKDLNHAFELYKSAADKNYVPAYGKVARSYDKGAGIEKDLEKSFEWYTKSAEAGDARGMYRLGNAYADGAGTVKDYQQAMKWYQKAADAGEADALGNIGVMYSNGEGVAQDYKKALEYFMKNVEARKESNGIMEYNIGNCYEYGEGVEKDINEASKWFTKSAEAGFTRGMTSLGDVYYNGTQGAEKDYDKAFYWYSKAAKGNDRYGRYGRWMTAECYEYGRGTDKNLKKAKDMYYDLYHDFDDNNAWRRFNRLYDAN